MYKKYTVDEMISAAKLAGVPKENLYAYILSAWRLNKKEHSELIESLKYTNDYPPYYQYRRNFFVS